MPTLSDPDTFADEAVSGTHLIGVVIEIPQPYCEQLHQMRTRCGDPLAGVIPPHVTLVPPTKVTAAERGRLHDHLLAAAARHQKFELELRGMQTFRPVSPVVYADVVAGGEQCAALEVSVRWGPLAVDVMFDYHPHVTVAHNLPDAVLDRAMLEFADYHAAFRITSFESYEWSNDDWQLQHVYELAERD